MEHPSLRNKVAVITGETGDLLGTLLYLTNDALSAFVTGIVIPVDGGFAAYSGV